MLLLLLFFFDGLLLLGDLFLGDLLLREDLAGDGPGLGVFGIFGRYLLDSDLFEDASDFGPVGSAFAIIGDFCAGAAPCPKLGSRANWLG